MRRGPNKGLPGTHMEEEFMRTRTKHTRQGIILAVAAVAGLIGGGALTASNTFASGATAPITGYAETTVSGGTVDSLAYTLNAGGDNVDSVTLVLNGDTTTSAVSIGFNGGATTSCGIGTFATTATTYTCDNGGVNFVQATSGLTATSVVIN